MMTSVDMKKYFPFYIGIGVLFVGLLVFNKQFFKGSKKYLGVTKAKEYKISSEKSASVMQVHVVPGQAVKKGELLVELSSAELRIEIDKQSNRINALKTERDEKAKLINSESAYLIAQRGIKIEEIEAKIAKIRKEKAINDELMNKIGEGAAISSDDSAQDLEIKSLLEKKKLHAQANEIKIGDIRQEHETEQSLLNNKIELAERELVLLTTEARKLNKYATFGGVVENVYVKEGEEVRSYTNIISINPEFPTSVVGYIMGRKPAANELGDEVLVASYENRTVTSQGKIIGLGAVTELPSILQKSTAVKGYGLQVFIQLEDGKAFTNGQKVIIY